MSGPTRREFLWTSVTAAAAGGLTGPMAVAQPGSVRVRRSVFSPLAPIADYRNGVRVMKSRPVTDRTSWLYQANIHGTSGAAPKGANWNQCQHGSFFFLSWHRMYLYWFERIVRKACGNNAFALPYWNYTSLTPSARQLPLAFRQPTFMGQTNALYDAARAPGMNSLNSPATLPYSATLFSTAFAYTNFSSPTGSGLSFGGQVLTAPAHFTGPPGQLEMQPHNVLHGLIGGSGDMGDPNRAARDAIFWLHHANIDRLWKRWLQQGGGRANPTGNAAWMKTVFRFFDENGQEVKMTGADILNTVTQLEYRYDDDPITLAPAAAVAAAARAPKEKKERGMQVVATAEKSEVALGNQPVSVKIGLKERAGAAVKRLTGADAADVPAHPIVLRLEDVTFDKQPGIYYEVYLNLPAKEEPDVQNGRFVGNLGFFATHAAGKKGDHKTTGAAKTSATFDISGVVRELARGKKWDPDQLTVTFVPRGLEDSEGRARKVKTEAKVNVGKVTLSSPKE
jgi:hypothetical protein